MPHDRGALIDQLRELLTQQRYNIKASSIAFRTLASLPRSGSLSASSSSRAYKLLVRVNRKLKGGLVQWTCRGDIISRPWEYRVATPYPKAADSRRQTV
jgi:hypothetical protein